MSNGDTTGAWISDSETNLVGKGNSQQVVNVDSARSSSNNADRDLLRIEQKIDQVLYRQENLERRVQQIEIAMQIGGKSSGSERLFMFLVILVAFLALAANVWMQVLR